MIDLHDLLALLTDLLSLTDVTCSYQVSVEAGVGVDLRDMEACLFRMKKHILRAEQTKGSAALGGRDKAKATTAAASKLSALAGEA